MFQWHAKNLGEHAALGWGGSLQAFDCDRTGTGFVASVLDALATPEGTVALVGVVITVVMVVVIMVVLFLRPLMRHKYRVRLRMKPFEIVIEPVPQPPARIANNRRPR